MEKYRLSQMKKWFKNKKRYRPLTLEEWKKKQWERFTTEDVEQHKKSIEIAKKQAMVNNNPIIALEQHRTFGGDLPRNVRRALTDEQLELVEGKDVQIITTYEIEIY